MIADAIPPGDRMPRQIDYYFSFSIAVGPISGHKLFRDVANTYDLKVNHKPVVLVDLFSETGGLPFDEAPSGAASATGWSSCSAGATSAA